MGAVGVFLSWDRKLIGRSFLQHLPSLLEDSTYFGQNEKRNHNVQHTKSLLEIIWPGKIKPADLSHSEENLASIIIH
jgi:hypothetical protein